MDIKGHCKIIKIYISEESKGSVRGAVCTAHIYLISLCNCRSSLK